MIEVSFDCLIDNCEVLKIEDLIGMGKSLEGNQDAD